jgi:hypothetical protein
MQVIDDMVLVNILVARPNNSEETEMITVTVFQEGDHFVAIPVLEDGERRKLRLPVRFDFQFLNHCIVPAKGTSDADLEIMKQIVSEFTA